MKIKDVEKRTGITSYNIRFYEKENLLIPKRNPVNGYREYTEEDILLLNRIKMLRMLDIPVSDIRKILYEKEALTSVLNTHLLKIKEEEKENTLKNELKKLDGTKDLKIGIIIGPEGGMDKTEVEKLAKAGAKVVTLGKRILRTETASISIMSNIVYEFEL